ncbi:MAG: hypothetical protein ACYSOQ_06285, partial [Planctomycetota bacterium]
KTPFYYKILYQRGLNEIRLIKYPVISPKSLDDPALRARRLRKKNKHRPENIKNKMSHISPSSQKNIPRRRYFFKLSSQQGLITVFIGYS